MGLDRAGGAARRWFEGIDAVAVIRGASTGFSILLAGGIVTPVVAGVPLVGRYWLITTAIVAFVVAGLRIGSSRTPALQGVLAAVGAYLLVLPVVRMASGGWDVNQVLATLGAAVVVGGTSSFLAGRRGRATNPPTRASRVRARRPSHSREVG
jgi:hypothetical protein